MGLMDFVKKQFIDILQWTEDGDDVLAGAFPPPTRRSSRARS